MSDGFCRIVEVRSCHPGGVYTIDWSYNQDAILITGTAIFEGDVVMKGIGWKYDGPASVGQVVSALQPAGIGSVEYEVSRVNLYHEIQLKESG